MDTCSSGFIEDEGSAAGLVYGTPLETPLHVKRPRRSSASPRAAGKVKRSPAPSTSQGDRLEKALQALQAGDGVIEVAAYETCVSSAPSTPRSARKTPRPRRLVRENKTEVDLHYGSEDDSADGGSDEEESIFQTFVPRVGRMFFDEDEEEYLPPPQPSPPAPEAVPFISPSPVTALPSDLFHFDWRALPNPPVPPTERREAFSEKNCGPTAPFLTPYDAFTAIWDRKIMEYIAAETNRYAQEVVEKQLQDGTLAPTSRINKWRDTDADELYVYFALLLAMGMCVKSDIKEYWLMDDLLATPNFTQTMPLKRFLLISKCLHFAPNSPHIATLSRPEAKLYKIEPIIRHLNTKFQSLYRLNRNIALDESLTMWKGLLNINQFIRNKSASVGIKTYEVCESQTGYLWRFKVYAGRQEKDEREVTPMSGAVPTLVLELLRGLEYRGHTVWMDNYYNSPALARVLKSLGFDCVGTLRTNRQLVPKDLSALTKANMTVGEVVSLTSGDVDIVVWRDQNRVALLSTYHGAAVHIAYGKTKPIVVHDYNVCMGGVDKKDQMLSMYPIERKRTRVWYKKFFRRLLNVSVLNALILHRHSRLPGARVHVKNHRNFRHDIIRNLLERHKSRPTLASSKATRMGVGRTKVPNVPILPAEVLKHFPEQYECIPGDKKERIRRSCVVCHKRVMYYCPECDVPLCPITCIKKYHKR